VPTDDRLRDALRSAAREPSLDGVAERVHAKHARRRTARRLQAVGMLAAVVVAAVVGSVTLLDNDQNRDREVAVPTITGSGPLVRIADGLRDGGDRDAKVTRVEIDPDEGYVRGPLLVSGDVITFAAYDRAGGSFKFPPSRIIRAQLDGTLIDRVDLEGEILSLSEGEGARWALTHDKTVIGPEDPAFRVKRIGPDNTVVSNPVPPGETPVGDVVAAGGGVWVPVRDGVLRFDSITGAYAAKIPLALDAARVVVELGKFVAVTDGIGIKRLDPSTDAAFDTGTVVLDTLDQSGQIVGLAVTPGGGALVARSPASGHVAVSLFELGTTAPLDKRLSKLRGAVPRALAVTDGAVWVDTDFHGRSLVQFAITASGLRVTHTVFIMRGDPEAVAFASQDTAYMTISGRLYQVAIAP
jgi:hypothetical protein